MMEDGAANSVAKLRPPNKETAKYTDYANEMGQEMPGWDGDD